MSSLKNDQRLLIRLAWATTGANQHQLMKIFNGVNRAVIGAWASRWQWSTPQEQVHLVTTVLLALLLPHGKSFVLEARPASEKTARKRRSHRPANNLDLSSLIQARAGELGLSKKVFREVVSETRRQLPRQTRTAIKAARDAFDASHDQDEPPRHVLGRQLVNLVLGGSTDAPN